MATVLHSQSKSRMSLYLSVIDKLSLMTSSIKWAPEDTTNRQLDSGGEAYGSQGHSFKLTLCHPGRRDCQIYLIIMIIKEITL